jgi:hypothetical protein
MSAIFLSLALNTVSKVKFSKMTPENFSNPPEKPLKTPEKFNVNLGGHPVSFFEKQV